MDVSSLAVNTILQSTHINTLEGGVEHGTQDTSAHTLDIHLNGNGEQQVRQQVATVRTHLRPRTLTLSFLIVVQHHSGGSGACASVLRIIKILVNTWAADVGRTQNPFADVLQMHFYRWLQNPSAMVTTAAEATR